MSKYVSIGKLAFYSKSCVALPSGNYSENRLPTKGFHRKAKHWCQNTRWLSLKVQRTELRTKSAHFHMGGNNFSVLLPCLTPFPDWKAWKQHVIAQQCRKGLSPARSMFSLTNLLAWLWTLDLIKNSSNYKIQQIIQQQKPTKDIKQHPVSFNWCLDKEPSAIFRERIFCQDSKRVTLKLQDALQTLDRVIHPSKTLHLTALTSPDCPSSHSEP